MLIEHLSMLAIAIVAFGVGSYLIHLMNAPLNAILERRRRDLFENVASRSDASPCHRCYCRPVYPGELCYDDGETLVCRDHWIRHLLGRRFRGQELAPFVGHKKRSGL